MSVQAEIDRISGNVSTALAAIADKGVTVPDGSTSDALAELIAAIETGGGLPDGIAAMTGGVYTPSKTVNNCTITHNLGVVPDFVIMYNKNNTIGSSNTALICVILGTVLYTVGSTTSNSIGVARTYPSSAQLPRVTTFYLTCTFKVSSSSYTGYFAMGKPYYWFAGVYA